MAFLPRRGKHSGEAERIVKHTAQARSPCGPTQGGHTQRTRSNDTLRSFCSVQKALQHFDLSFIFWLFSCLFFCFFFKSKLCNYTQWSLPALQCLPVCSPGHYAALTDADINCQTLNPNGAFFKSDNLNRSMQCLGVRLQKLSMTTCEGWKKQEGKQHEPGSKWQSLP